MSTPALLALDPLPAVACTCRNRWPAFVNCLGHDHEDCTGDSRRVGEIPFDLFDFDLDRWFNALDCDGAPDFEPIHERERTGMWAGYDGDCDGDGTPAPRCALSGPIYTPCTYADCDVELGGGCVLRKERG